MPKGRIENVDYSRRFLKSLEKLPKRIIAKAETKERIFLESPFHPVLGTHKLPGKDKECWAFDIDRAYRIKFIFLSDTRVLFLDIGTHDIYR